MSLVKSASPQVINLGVNDLSVRNILPEKDPQPQHLPLFFIYAKKGTTKKKLMSGAKLPFSYGIDTFTNNSKYYKHTTRYLNAIISEGNNCMVQRVVPSDANTASNIVIYIDKLDQPVPNYVRDSMGNKVIDSGTNDYKVDTATPTIQGTMIKYITEYETSSTTDFGMLTPKPGTMTYDDGNGNITTSTMYPFMEVKAKYKGEYYNNIGISIESSYNENADTTIMANNKSMPYRLGLHYRDDKNSSTKTLRSLYGETSVLFTLKDRDINPHTTNRMDIETIFNTNWYNETDVLKALRYEEYENIYIYRDNLELIYNGIMANEKTHISATAQTWDDGLDAATIEWFDFSTDDQTELDSEIYLLNIFAGKSTKNINYFTVMLSDNTPVLTGTQKEISLNADSTVFLNGGSDGTMDNAHFEEQVSNELAKYLDPDSEVMDTAINLETMLYDSGYTLETKKLMTNFITLRNNTAIILSTHDDALKEKTLPLSDIRAIAVSLKTRVKLAPESTYFGTSVARGIVVGGTGILRDGTTRDRIPLSYEIAIKTARMMGASDYKWKATYGFDHGYNAVLRELISIEPSFIPAGVKPVLWDAGLVWAQPKDRVQYFFPAIQTIYENDTSTLNSWYTVAAICTVNTIADDTWREFTGSSVLNEAQFKDAVTNYVISRLTGIFGGIIKVIPEVVITENDAARGYTWHLVNRVYTTTAAMKSVLITYVENRRPEDLNK